MSDAIADKPAAKPSPHWILPGGAQGLQGAIPKVAEAISLMDIPEHDKTSLLEKLRAATEGTEFNYVQFHANNQEHSTPEFRDIIYGGHIRISKKLI